MHFFRCFLWFFDFYVWEGSSGLTKIFLSSFAEMKRNANSEFPSKALREREFSHVNSDPASARI